MSISTMSARTGGAARQLAILGLCAAGLAWPAAANAARPSANVNASHSTEGASHSAASWKWSKGKRIPHTKSSDIAGGLTCPSPKLCVAFGTEGSFNSGIFWTTHPSAGASKWHYQRLSKQFNPADLSCDRSGKIVNCAVAGAGGVLWQSGHPTGSSWGSTQIDSVSNNLSSVSCWVNLQCAELDNQGNALTNAATNVTSDDSLFPADAGQPGWSVSCAPLDSSSKANPFCAATAQSATGSVAFSTDPASGKWTVVKTPGHRDIDELSCPTDGFCIATEDESMRIGVAGHHKSGKDWGSDWKSFALPHAATEFPEASVVYCASKSLCAFSGHDSKGNFIDISTKPAAKRSAWHGYTIHDGNVADIDTTASGIACPTAKECLVLSSEGRIIVGHRK